MVDRFHPHLSAAPLGGGDMTQPDTVGAALPRHEAAWPARPTTFSSPGAGFIGCHLVEALVESGHDVLDIDGTIATNKN